MPSPNWATQAELEYRSISCSCFNGCWCLSCSPSFDIEEFAFDSDAIASAAASALIPPQSGCPQLLAGPHCRVHCWLKNKFNFRSANTTRSQTKHTHHAQHNTLTQTQRVLLCVCLLVPARIDFLSCCCFFSVSSTCVARVCCQAEAEFFLPCHNYLLPDPLQALMMKCSCPATKKSKRMRDEAFNTFQPLPTHRPHKRLNNPVDFDIKFR